MKRELELELREFTRIQDECVSVDDVIAKYGPPTELIESRGRRQFRFNTGWSEIRLIVIQKTHGELEFLAEPC